MGNIKNIITGLPTNLDNNFKKLILDFLKFSKI